MCRDPAADTATRAPHFCSTRSRADFDSLAECESEFRSRPPRAVSSRPSLRMPVSCHPGSMRPCVRYSDVLAACGPIFRWLPPTSGSFCRYPSMPAFSHPGSMPRWSTCLDHLGLCGWAGPSLDPRDGLFRRCLAARLPYARGLADDSKPGIHPNPSPPIQTFAAQEQRRTRPGSCQARATV